MSNENKDNLIGILDMIDSRLENINTTLNKTCPKFITVKPITGKEVLLNTSHITNIQQRENGDAIITTSDGDGIIVTNKYEDICKLVLGK